MADSDNDGSRAFGLLWLTGLVLVAAAVRALCFSGLGTSDCLGYVNAAANLSRGDYPWESYPGVYMRPGFLLPLCPLVVLGGYTSWVVNLYPLLCGLGLVPLTYWLGTRLVGPDAGPWAAFVIVFSTQPILNATGIVPDTPLAFWSTLAIALVLVARDVTGKKALFLLCLAAGIALGVAWTTKEPALFMLPVVFVLICQVKGNRVPPFLALGAGLLFIVALEMGFWAAMNGDPLTRFRWLTGGTAHATDPALGPTFECSLWEYPLKMFVIISQDGLFYYFLVPAMIWALWQERCRLWFPLFWVTFVFLCLEFGSTSLSTYRPFPHQPRYLMLLVPGGAVLIGAWLSRVFLRQSRTACALCLLYVLVCGFLAYLDPVTSRTDIEMAKACVHYLRKQNAAEVFSDQKFAGYINYVRRDFDDAPPEAEVWLQDELKPIRDVSKHPEAFVVRFDHSLRRLHASEALSGDLPLDAAYGWLEKNANKDVLELDFGRPQRAALAGVWWVVRKLPLPRSIETRLKTAFSLHLARPVATIYQVSNGLERKARMVREESL